MIREHGYITTPTGYVWEQEAEYARQREADAMLGKVRGQLPGVIAKLNASTMTFDGLWDVAERLRDLAEIVENAAIVLDSEDY